VTLFVTYDAAGIVGGFIETSGDIPIVSGYVAEVDPSFKDRRDEPMFYDAANSTLTFSVLTAAVVDKNDIEAGNVDYATLSGLPNPCWLKVNGATIQVTGGTYKIESAASTNSHIELVGSNYGGPWVVTAHDLTALKAQVKDRIDAAAETCRLKYITPGSGQAMVYQQKAEEAKACLAAISPVDSNYPLLSAEATATGVTISELAQNVATLTAQWIGLASAIEARRIGGKKVVSDAVTVAAVLAGAAINWP
jgi:hypothetical protein